MSTAKRIILYYRRLINTHTLHIAAARSMIYNYSSRRSLPEDGGDDVQVPGRFSSRPSKDDDDRLPRAGFTFAARARLGRSAGHCSRYMDRIGLGPRHDDDPHTIILYILAGRLLYYLLLLLLLLLQRTVYLLCYCSAIAGADKTFWSRDHVVSAVTTRPPPLSPSLANGPVSAVSVTRGWVSIIESAVYGHTEKDALWGRPRTTI